MRQAGTMNEATKKLLIVDDDSGLRRQLRWAFDSYRVSLAEDRQTALELLATERPPVVILDLGLPPDADGPTEGLATLEQILNQAPATKVVMMTGQAERAYAVQAVAKGAYDFYQKPVEIEVLGLIVDRAYRLWSLEDEHQRMSMAGPGVVIPGLIMVNRNMQKITDTVAKLANSDVGALIIGESGTGKELMARGIHMLSARSENVFVPINCAAIPDPLLESELFGHEKGAFTGAVKTIMGKVELADGGTLFLDEIGDLGMSLQAKLLRFLQERVIERVGGRRQIEVDVRVISATNQELPDLIKEGRFREDLYYRISEFTIAIPPLRERPDDAIVIANHILQEFTREQGRQVHGFSNEALVAISSHTWPGNVRELQNRIKRAVITAHGRQIGPADLELEISGESILPETLKATRERAEREAILSALKLASGNVTKAAKILDISRPKLYDLMRYHHVKV
jgi:two-component system NtrC family response regulator